MLDFVLHPVTNLAITAIRAQNLNILCQGEFTIPFSDLLSATEELLPDNLKLSAHAGGGLLVEVALPLITVSTVVSFLKVSVEGRRVSASFGIGDNIVARTAKELALQVALRKKGFPFEKTAGIWVVDLSGFIAPKIDEVIVNHSEFAREIGAILTCVRLEIGLVGENIVITPRLLVEKQRKTDIMKTIDSMIMVRAAAE